MELDTLLRLEFSSYKVSVFDSRLIVALSYTVPNLNPPEPILIERYFKFQVKKPLDVKTKLYNAEVRNVHAKPKTTRT